MLRPNDYSKELTTQKKMTHFELMLNLMKWRKEIELRKNEQLFFSFGLKVQSVPRIIIYPR